LIGTKIGDLEWHAIRTISLRYSTEFGSFGAGHIKVAVGLYCLWQKCSPRI